MLNGIEAIKNVEREIALKQDRFMLQLDEHVNYIMCVFVCLCILNDENAT